MRRRRKSDGGRLVEAVEETYRELAIEALRDCDGNVAASARLLGISRTAMHRIMKWLRITRHGVLRS